MSENGQSEPKPLAELGLTERELYHLSAAWLSHRDAENVSKCLPAIPSTDVPSPPPI